MVRYIFGVHPLRVLPSKVDSPRLRVLLERYANLTVNFCEG